MISIIINYVILAGLVAVGIYELKLIKDKKPTISQQYQKLFGSLVDMVIFVVGLVGICLVNWYLFKIDLTLAVVIAGFWGHVTFANKETHGDNK